MAKKDKSKYPESITRDGSSDDNGVKLRKFQDRFHTSISLYELDLFDDYEAVVKGTKLTRKNVNDTSTSEVRLTNNVPRKTHELIESQVDVGINNAIVQPRRDGYGFAARIAQDKLNDDLRQMRFNEFLDLNERNTLTHGISGILVSWDPNKKSFDYIGDKEIINLHAKNIIPQPAVYKLKDMDYFFIITSVTKQYIYSKYGVSVENETEEYPEINTLDFEGRQSLENETDADPFEDKVTEVVCFYKDEEGDIGKYTWVGDTTLEDLPKYYYPRMLVCSDCDYENPIGSVECGDCGSKKLKREFKMYEMVTEDKTLRPIIVTESEWDIEENEETGEPTVNEVKKKKVVERKIKKGDKIPIFAPKIYPVAVRLNIPQNFEFSGQSDVEIVRDQQETIKKVSSIMERLVIEAPRIITMPEEVKTQLTNDIYQKVEASAKDIQGMDTFEFIPNLQPYLQLIDYQEKVMTDTSGVTNAYQGKQDTTAKSGVAKQISVEQTLGRLASKGNNKQMFLEDLYRIMFFFDIAFTNEKRPYVRKGIDTDYEHNYFDKHEFLIKTSDDKDAEWVYNTDFLISSDNSGYLPQDNVFMFEQSLNLFGSELLTDIEFWELISTTNFPNANLFYERRKQQQEELEKQEELPEEAILSPEEQLLQQQPLPQELPQEQLPPGLIPLPPNAPPLPPI